MCTMTIKKIVKDFKAYLDGIEKLSRTLSPEKKDELATVLYVMLSLLCAFKRDSGLGRYKFPWEK